MGAQHVAILKGMGLPDDRIAAIEALKEEDVKTYKADDDLTSIRTGLSTALLNDADFLGKIPADKVPESVKKLVEGAQYGRFMNEAKDVIKLLKVDVSDLSEKDAGSLKTFLTKAIHKYGESVNKDSSVGELQKQLMAAAQEKEALDTGWKTKHETELGTAKKGYEGVLTRVLLINELNAIDDVDYNVAPSYIIDPILKKLSGQYHIALNESLDGVKFMQKDHPNLPAMKKDKTGELSVKDALKEMVLADKVGKLKDKTKIEKDKEIEVVLGDNTNKIGGGIMDKINKNLPKE